jgi:hypothetical protein
MNDTEDLRDLLTRPPGASMGSPDLAAIHSKGRARRRVRRLSIGAAAAVLATVGAVGAQTVLGNDTGRNEDARVATSSPDELSPETLSPLAQRALKEIPGAVQVSDMYVVIPGGGTLTPASLASINKKNGYKPNDWSQPVALSAHSYSGVTFAGSVEKFFPETTVPRWLYEGAKEVIKANEKKHGDQYSDLPMSEWDFTEGVIVDQGPAQLSCQRPAGGCTIWGYVGGGRVTGQGAIGDPEPGKPMKVSRELVNFSTGERTSLYFAGIDGTDIASVEFVTTDGTKISGEVESDTVAAGATIMWAVVPGRPEKRDLLANVIAYDADGNVVENHDVLAECAPPNEC